jgi:hypothetical protein
MNLKDFVAVGGLPGLYKLIATRSNGLLIQELDSDKTRFASSRKHQFTPLESVAIYTEEDSIELSAVFERIKENLEKNPLPDLNATKETSFNYFAEIVPDYDEERVLISDVKKVIKWFKYLNDRDLLKASEEESSPADEESAKDESKKKNKKKATD